MCPSAAGLGEGSVTEFLVTTAGQIAGCICSSNPRPEPTDLTDLTELLGQVSLDPYLFDLIKLRFQPVDVGFLVL